MRIKYANAKVKQQCSNVRAATKLFGGDKKMAVSLLARINAIEQADVIKDIIMMPNFRFHKLQGNLKKYFAIDVKTPRDKWRIIMRPLDDSEKPFDPLKIDEIVMTVKIVEIREVSAHYE